LVKQTNPRTCSFLPGVAFFCFPLACRIQWNDAFLWKGKQKANCMILGL